MKLVQAHLLSSSLLIAFAPFVAIADEPSPESAGEHRATITVKACEAPTTSVHPLQPSATCRITRFPTGLQVHPVQSRRARLRWRNNDEFRAGRFNR